MSPAPAGSGAEVVGEHEVEPAVVVGVEGDGADGIAESGEPDAGRDVGEAIGAAALGVAVRPLIAIEDRSAEPPDVEIEPSVVVVVEPKGSGSRWTEDRCLRRPRRPWSTSVKVRSPLCAHQVVRSGRCPNQLMKRSSKPSSSKSPTATAAPPSVNISRTCRFGTIGELPGRVHEADPGLLLPLPRNVGSSAVAGRLPRRIPRRMPRRMPRQRGSSGWLRVVLTVTGQGDQGEKQPRPGAASAATPGHGIACTVHGLMDLSPRLLREAGWPIHQRLTSGVVSPSFSDQTRTP